MRRLGPRLEAILSLIPQGARIADIGCDHGKLSVEAVRCGRAEFAVAADISGKCLEKARILAEKCNVLDKMSFVCCDGLAGIEGADTVIIAGMGGCEIIKILSEAEKSYKNYILSPHKNADKLQNFLRERGFVTETELNVQEKRHSYVIIKCRL